jgi:hypothetical protein
MRWDGDVNGGHGTNSTYQASNTGQAPHEDATGRAALWATFRNERRESHAVNAKVTCPCLPDTVRRQLRRGRFGRGSALAHRPSPPTGIFRSGAPS